MAGMYIENNMPTPEFMSNFLGITEMVRLITLLNMIIVYYLAIVLRKGQNILSMCRNIPVDNIFITVYNLQYSFKLSN